MTKEKSIAANIKAFEKLADERERARWQVLEAYKKQIADIASIDGAISIAEEMAAKLRAADNYYKMTNAQLTALRGL